MTSEGTRGLLACIVRCVKIEAAHAASDWWTPRRIFWIATIGIYLSWCLVTLSLQGNLALDHVEMLMWGRGWQVSYWKHPPLPAWLAEAVSVATGRAVWPQFFIAPALVATTAWVVWRAALDLVGPWRALLAALSLQGCVYYNYESDVLNHNLIQLPFVAALIWAGWHAVRGSARAWIAFGVISGIAIYGKHTAAFSSIAVVVFSLLVRDTRRQWLSRGPWLGMLAGTLTVLPHLWAMWRLGFSPLRTATLDHDGGFHESVPAEPWWGRIAFPAEFVGAQFLMLLGVWIMMFLLFARPGEPTIEHMRPAKQMRPAAHYYAWCTAFPVMLAAVLSAIVNLHMNSLWAMAWLPFAGLAVLLWVQRPIGMSGLRTFWIAWCIQAGATLVFVAVKMSVGPYLSGRATNVLFDGTALAAQVGERWNTHFPGAPLTLVIGPHFVAGSVCVYHPSHPELIIDGVPIRSPWIETKRIEREGAVLVWEGDATPSWADQFGARSEAERFDLPLRTSAALPPRRMAIAFISPQPSQQEP